MKKNVVAILVLIAGMAAAVPTEARHACYPNQDPATCGQHQADNGCTGRLTPCWYGSASQERCENSPSCRCIDPLIEQCTFRDPAKQRTPAPTTKGSSLYNQILTTLGIAPAPAPQQPKNTVRADYVLTQLNTPPYAPAYGPALEWPCPNPLAENTSRNSAPTFGNTTIFCTGPWITTTHNGQPYRYRSCETHSESDPFKL